ncbi:hypothetical protein GCM10027610_135870 [Dactylosporangium cerinum]
MIPHRVSMPRPTDKKQFHERCETCPVTTRTTRPTVRFRRSASLAVAAGIATIGAIPLLAGGLWFLPVLLVPIAIAVWAWRAGTDVDAAGFTVRALLGSRRVPWAAVDGLVSQDGTVQARLANGHFVKLDAVRPADVERITALTGPDQSNA